MTGILIVDAAGMLAPALKPACVTRLEIEHVERGRGGNLPRQVSHVVIETRQRRGKIGACRRGCRDTCHEGKRQNRRRTSQHGCAFSLRAAALLPVPSACLDVTGPARPYGERPSMRGTRRNPWRWLTEARVTYVLKVLMVLVLGFYAGAFLLEILGRIRGRRLYPHRRSLSRLPHLPGGAAPSAFMPLVSRSSWSTRESSRA